jgi:hypothetical protein
MVVKCASGASARALENGCLRFVLATKTHDDIPFAANADIQCQASNQNVPARITLSKF